MEVNTKFDLNDEVYLIVDNVVVKKKITGINVSVYYSYPDCNISEIYTLNYDDVKYPVNCLFETKEELLKSL